VSAAPSTQVSLHGAVDRADRVRGTLCGCVTSGAVWCSAASLGVMRSGIVSGRPISAASPAASRRSLPSTLRARPQLALAPPPLRHIVNTSLAEHSVVFSFLVRVAQPIGKGEVQAVGLTLAALRCRA